MIPIKVQIQMQMQMQIEIQIHEKTQIAGGESIKDCLPGAQPLWPGNIWPHSAGNNKITKWWWLWDWDENEYNDWNVDDEDQYKVHDVIKMLTMSINIRSTIW